MTPGILVLAQEAPGGSHFSQMLVEGLSLGTIYALLAVGFVIIFKATQVLNFAHGALAALGAFLVAGFATVWDVPGRWMPWAPSWLSWFGSVLLALVAMALIGMFLERVFLRPMVGEELFAIAIVTLGLDIVIRTITNDWIGTQPRPLGAPWGLAVIDLGWVERGLSVTLDEAQAERAMTDDIERIVAAARRTVADAGLQPQEIDALYFTGGSTGLRLLTDRLAAAFDTARPMRGDALASVATGLGLYATRRFAPQSAQAA